jgi:hypothetical protein
VSVIGSLLTVQTIRSATSRIQASSLSAAVKAQTIAGVHDSSSGYVAPSSLSTNDRAVVRSALEHGVVSGTRFALVFAAFVIALGALVSLMIPGGRPRLGQSAATSPAGHDPLEPIAQVATVLGDV